MYQIRQKKPKPSKRKWINDERRLVRSRCDEWRAVRWATSGAIVDRVARQCGVIVWQAARSKIAIALLIDRRAVRIRRARSSIAPLDPRSHCAISSIAPRDLVDRDRQSRRSSARCDRRTSGAIWALSSLSLWSGLSLLSLPLSLFLEMIWRENEGAKSFPGQRWKYSSTGSHFPENIIFRDSQTCGFGGKWFPEIIFTQNKRTLSNTSALLFRQIYTILELLQFCNTRHNPLMLIQSFNLHIICSCTCYCTVWLPCLLWCLCVLLCLLAAALCCSLSCSGVAADVALVVVDVLSSCLLTNAKNIMTQKGTVSMSMR